MKTQVYYCNVGPPVIQEPEHDNEKPLRKGSRVTLHCTASGYGSQKYWERRISENHNWYTVKTIISTTSYRTGQTGQYRCNVTNKAGSVVSPVITLFGNNPLV